MAKKKPESAMLAIQGGKEAFAKAVGVPVETVKIAAVGPGVSAMGIKAEGMAAVRCDFCGALISTTTEKAKSQLVGSVSLACRECCEALEKTGQLPAKA